MHKFIESDVHNGLTYLKCAIMNALWDIEEGHETEIVLGKYVPFSLLVECAEQRGWVEDESEDWDTNGWQCDCWYYMKTPKDQCVLFTSCLWKGQETKIEIVNEI